MKAVLLAGGRGTRMGALTDDTPKPLLPVSGRPLIEHSIQKLVGAGATDLIIATGYLAEQFEQVLGDGARWGVNFHYSVEQEPLGTGGALGLAAQRFIEPGDEVVVVNADLVSEHDLRKQQEFHRVQNAEVTIHVRQVDDPRRYGVVRFTSDFCVTEFIEKPTTVAPEWINAGTYIAHGEVLLSLAGDSASSWERDALPGFITEGRRVFAFQDNVYFRDVGTPEDIRMVQNDRQ